MKKERLVKGNVLVEMVSVVRARPDLAWNEYLTEENLEVVNSTFLPGDWYPVELAGRLFAGIFEMIAGSSLEVLEKIARSGARQLFQGPYKAFVVKGDPASAMRNYLRLQEKQFNFPRFSCESLSEKKMRAAISELGEPDKNVPAFMVFQSVQFEELVRANGGKEVKVESRVVEGEEGFRMEFDIYWE